MSNRYQVDQYINAIDILQSSIPPQYLFTSIVNKMYKDLIEKLESNGVSPSAGTLKISLSYIYYDSKEDE